MGLFEVYICVIGTIFVINSILNTLISNALLDDINKGIGKCITCLSDNDYSDSEDSEDANDYVIKTMYS